MADKVMGVDEAGRGPVIGPIVVAGVEGLKETFATLNVKDSKKLSPGRREYLYEKIYSHSDNVIIREVSADEIDKMRKVMTMNVMEVNLYSEVISSGDSMTVYVDSVDVNEERFAKDIINAVIRKTPARREVIIHSKHKADSLFPVVSAASIIAKVHRDRALKEIEKEAGMEIGSGYPSDPNTTAFIKKWYDMYGDVPPHTRKSWATVKNILGPGYDNNKSNNENKTDNSNSDNSQMNQQWKQRKLL